MVILNRTEIEALIDLSEAAIAIEDAYRATSKGKINLPPVGHITFPTQGADCHIKYGHLIGAPHFTVKVATGFPNNAGNGLKTGNGLVLVLSAEDGTVKAVLHDEMVLTDIRTGLGGAISSRLLARNDSSSILIVGTGPQARRQIEAHAVLLEQPIEFKVWGRSFERAEQIAADMSKNCRVLPVVDLEVNVRTADVIVTTTGATSPIIRAEWVAPGTHITAVGADAPGKQELDVALVEKADVLAADLLSQCLDHGELSHAMKAGRIAPEDVFELGVLLDKKGNARQSDTQITLVDLTGVAAQDIAMADFVLEAWAYSQNDV